VVERVGGERAGGVAGRGTDRADGHHAGGEAGGAADQFRRLADHSPDGLWRAPGRANLIGEHTDYNGGLALPFAIDRTTVVAARRRQDKLARVWSVALEDSVTADLEHLDRSALPAWARYPLGVFWAMERRGVDLPGIDMSVSSTVPLGSGLSSSAALTVAVAVALDDLTGAALGKVELAKICQEAEAQFAGTPCGLLDQFAALQARAGHGVLIDFSSLGCELVPLEIGPLAVISTGVQHANSAGAYANRRAACQEAASRLGVELLCQASLKRAEKELSGELLRRARHVLSENARVAEFARRLRADLQVGELLTASHVSLRDDYEVSCPELDLAVGTALGNGASGARLTGAGFGGCAISLGATAGQLAGPMSEAFAEAGFGTPDVFEIKPSDGAGRLA
jgi:galactokinase